MKVTTRLTEEIAKPPETRVCDGSGARVRLSNDEAYYRKATTCPSCRRYGVGIARVKGPDRENPCPTGAVAPHREIYVPGQGWQPLVKKGKK